ncbi:MAG: hypothetical protein H0T55_00555 [Rubrobacteraceae bacterium]|nr:hypothetical protein [Rubrobacteraceae bacterium]MBA3636049.1 hypothetical protein [Rubrobacteraceae bacterium]MDQ3436739.1 hypothetical protein [Actinomycetota bacterium]
MVGVPFEGKVETVQRSIDTVSFWLKPVGFFDRNPALDVPSSANGHCHNPGGGAP